MKKTLVKKVGYHPSQDWRTYISDVSNEENRKILEVFLDSVESKRGTPLRPNTKRGYIFALKLFSNHIKKPFAEITKRDLNEFVTYLRKQGQKEGSINKRKIAIRKLYYWMQEFEYLEENPAKKLRLGVKKKKVIYLSPREVGAMCEAAKAKCYRDYAILKTLFHTGLRATELIELSVLPSSEGNHIDFERGIMHVNKTKSADRRSFKIPKWSELKPILERYLNGTRPYDGHPYRVPPTKDPLNPMFTSNQKKRLAYTNLNNIFSKYVVKAGIERLELFPEATFKDVAPHTARRTFATSYVRAGGNILKLKHILGHQDLNTTQLYLGMIKAELDEDDETDLYNHTPIQRRQPEPPEPQPIPQPQDDHIVPVHARNKYDFTYV